jgi:glycerol-3-phosphate acyltransferase PlsY
MPGPVTGPALVIAAYVLGAVPWGYLAGRLGRGIDLRTIGSGGTGATNVLRALGARASAVVLALDLLKGAAPVVAGKALGIEPIWVAAAAVAAVVGHCWSPFIGFKGGKGVATGAGAAIALYPPVLISLPVMAALIWATRYVSLGSLVGAALASAFALASAASGRLDWASALAITAMAAIIAVRHTDNIQRLRTGTERRLGQSVSIS